MKMQKIVIAGGTGFIGRNIASYFGNDNEIVILSRGKGKGANNAFEEFEIGNNASTRLVQWSGKDGGEWEKKLMDVTL
jgi:nucleoside-diphosphate-sugar epimerase